MGAQGCRVGRDVSGKRALHDPNYQVMEFDRAHLTVSKAIDPPEAAPTVHAHHLFALLLNQLQQDFSVKAGAEISHLIMPEPAGDIGAFRQQAARAAELAGMRIISFVKESVAACHYYAETLSPKLVPSSVLVIQFGSEAASATLLQLSAGAYRVVAETVDAASADPIRQMLARLVAAEATRRYGSRFNHQNCKGDIIRCANRLKHELQVCKSSRVELRDWLNEDPIEIHLQRDHFHTLMEPIVRNTLQVASACLARAQSSWTSVDQLILLGDLVGWPSVADAICEQSGKPISSVICRNSETAVAAGASILARASKLPTSPMAQFAFGIRVSHWAPEPGQRDRFFIEPGTHVPVTRTRSFFTRSQGQKTVWIQVITKDRGGNTIVLGEVEYGPLCGTRRGYPIEISLTVKASHQVIMTVKDPVSGVSEEHFFDPLNEFHPAHSDRQIFRRLKLGL
jgi:molecular chaperone DnaK (HSP70)